MTHARKHQVAVVQNRVARGNGRRRAVRALEGDDADVVVTLDLENANGTTIARSKVKREAQHLEVAERVQVRAMTRNNLAEGLLGNKGGTAHVVDAQLHVSALVIGVVQTRDDARNVEQAACNLGNH